MGDSFDTSMDPSGRYTRQERIKIIEAYFAAKSVLLTQLLAGTMYLKEGQLNVWWPNFGRQMFNFRIEWQMLTSRDHSSFGIIPGNIQNLRERHEDFPENQHAIFHKKIAFREHQF